jgi:hypothetical protein
MTTASIARCALVLTATLAAGCVIDGQGRGRWDPDRWERGWEGGQLPDGSYRKTCRYERLDGYHLKAECRRDDGTWRASWLDLRSCRKDIRNQDGYLRCGEWEYQPGRPAFEIPQGSYRKSCARIRIRDGQLKAECRTIAGSWRQVSVPVRRCRRFANDDGRLVCER